MAPAHRQDGFAPIADYGVLGDGRTVALVAGDGQVDWWPIPSLDAPPACAAILDPTDGGFFRLAPRGDYRVERRYLPGTNVLEATYTLPDGAVARVTDSLNTGLRGFLPWTELARRVEGVRGEVDFAWHFEPGDRFGSARAWTTSRGGVPVVVLGDQTIGLVIDGGDSLCVEHACVRGRLMTTPGSRALVAAVAADDQPLFLPAPEHIDARIDRTVDTWRRFTRDTLDYRGPHGGHVERSALTLKLLIAASGAIAAAATTSLPERIGGPKNWDYLYAWVRDASFTLDALITLGMHEEAQLATTWLLRALRQTSPQLHIFYDLDGDPVGQETQLAVPGYRNSAPVRAGNGASTQSQLGTYGDLFDTVSRYLSAGHVLDAASGRMLADLADRCCDTWKTKDSGIWELGQLEHYTISKIGCWVALERAAHLATEGHLPSHHSERWRTEAREIRRWVLEHCWSERKRAYTFYAGSEDLDAAVLLAGRTGFDRSRRLATTAEAVIAELGAGPLVYRYSGMEKEEGAFVACSFWLVEALAWTGQVARAEKTMEEAVALASPLGLLSEEIDPESGDFLGNTPQGLSHLALINAAHTLHAVASGSTP